MTSPTSKRFADGSRHRDRRREEAEARAAASTVRTCGHSHTDNGARNCTAGKTE